MRTIAAVAVAAAALCAVANAQTWKDRQVALTAHPGGGRSV
jgi:hypothetical protein